MATYLDSHRLPQLYVQGPTFGPISDVPTIRQFRDALIKPSGVSEPTVLVVNLDGRFPTPSVLVELILPLAQAAKSGVSGPIVLVVCTQDEGVRVILRALAESHQLAMFIARSPKDLDDAEPVGPLTATDLETLEILHKLGGRATGATFANAANLEPNAATNRLVGVLNKGFVQRVDRPRRQGQLFLDPRAAARLPEDPADPTSGDFDAPERVRSHVRAITEMQVIERGPGLANAWQELLSEHKEYLSAEHERLAALVKEGNQEAIAAEGRRFAKKQAEARKRKPSS
jgi:hypothetical protein